MLVSWGVRVKIEGVTTKAPTNFVEARDQAGEVLNNYELLKKEAAGLQTQIAANPPNKAELQTKLNDVNQSLLEAPQAGDSPLSNRDVDVERHDSNR